MENRNKLYIIHVPRMDFETWMRFHPDSTEEEWRIAMNPHRIRSFVYKIAKSQEVLNEDFKIKIVTMDNNFFEWLHNEGLALNDRNIEKYMMQISDERAAFLMSDMNDNFCLQCFLLQLPNLSKGNRTLPDKLNKMIESHIMMSVECDDVYVPGDLIPIENLTELTCSSIYNELINTAEQYFEFERKETNLKKYKGSSKSNYYILPFIIKQSFDSAVFTQEDLMKDDDIGPSLNLSVLIKFIAEACDCDASLLENTLPIAHDIINMVAAQKNNQINIEDDLIEFLIKNVSELVYFQKDEYAEIYIRGILNSILNMLQSEDVQDEIVRQILMINKIKKKPTDKDDDKII